MLQIGGTLAHELVTQLRLFLLLSVLFSPRPRPCLDLPALSTSFPLLKPFLSLNLPLSGVRLPFLSPFSGSLLPSRCLLAFTHHLARALLDCSGPNVAGSDMYPGREPSFLLAGPQPRTLTSSIPSDRSAVIRLPEAQTGPVGSF